MEILPIYVNVKYSVMFFGRKARTRNYRYYCFEGHQHLHVRGASENALEEKFFSFFACTTCCFALLQGLIRTYSLSVIGNL